MSEMVQIISSCNNPSFHLIVQARNDRSGATKVRFALAGSGRLEMAVKQVVPDGDGFAVKGRCVTGKPAHVYYDPATGKGSVRSSNKPKPRRSLT